MANILNNSSDNSSSIINFLNNFIAEFYFLNQVFNHGTEEEKIIANLIKKVYYRILLFSQQRSLIKNVMMQKKTMIYSQNLKEEELRLIMKMLPIIEKT